LVSDDSLAVGSTVQADEPAAVLEAGAIAPETMTLPQLATTELVSDAGVGALRLERSWALTAEADLLTESLVQPLGQVLAAEVDALTGELVAAV